MNIAQKIKYIRNDIAKESQQKFATKINVSKCTIKHWENGTGKPTINHLICISLIYNVSIDYLLFEDAHEELCLYGLNDREYQLLSDLIEIYKKKTNVER